MRLVVSTWRKNFRNSFVGGMELYRLDGSSKYGGSR